jgi:hypothetical protein
MRDHVWWPRKARQATSFAIRHRATSAGGAQPKRVAARPKEASDPLFTCTDSLLACSALVYCFKVVLFHLLKVVTLAAKQLPIACSFEVCSRNRFPQGEASRAASAATASNRNSIAGPNE